MSMNKSTSAAGKASNPPLNLVDYSDDEEQTTPQQSQTSQPMSEDLHTAAEQLDSESDAESEPVGSTRKKKNEEEDAENNDSDEVEEVDAENVEPPISVKEKEKKRKAPSSATQSNPVRKLTRKTFASGIKSQAKAKTTSGAASSEKIKRGSTSAERLAKQSPATRGSEVIVTVRGQKYEFSPTMIDQYFDVSPLEGEEVEVEATMDEVNSDELADFLTEGTREMKNLTTSSLSPCKVALLVLAAYNWVPSSNKNAASIDHAKLVYKMFHGVCGDIEVLVYNQVLNLGVIQKEGEKKDTRWLIFPRIIYAREAEKKAQRQAKKKGKSASTSTAAPPSRPPPSTPRPERTDPSGYVPPRQSPRSAGKFQIIHLGSIAAPGKPIDAEEAKLALDTTSAAIQHLATAMQILTSVVGQIASMMFPNVEPSISVKEKEKKRKAPSSATQRNPVRKSTRKTSSSGIKSQTKAKITSGVAPSEKVKRGLTSAERLAGQRYASFASREIIPERSVDLNSEDTWGYLSIIKKGKLEKTVTGLRGYIPEIVKKFYAALPDEMTRAPEVIVTVRG
ncbi:hypothetical protein F2Q68_00041223 [Brassica cretica]|uniref:Uncharacterized protein n=1 Tax=Brassica cretica TaxID=69181 RepID=A0A8S9MJ45_BRACR|nr:hypothetical protein F2Q68_00041223 [Brassica cretica]